MYDWVRSVSYIRATVIDRIVR